MVSSSRDGVEIDAHWGDIELPDEDELAELEALADVRQIDRTPQLEPEGDEE